MKQNADISIRKILEHEGGFVNNPTDRTARDIWTIEELDSH